MMYLNEGFFQHILNTHGRDVLNLLKTWMNTNKKLAAIKNRRIFLLQCRTKKVFPQHITNNMNCLNSLKSENHPFLNEIDKIVFKFKKNILNLEIKITVWKLKKLEQELNEIKTTVSDFLPTSVFLDFSDSCINRYKKLFNVIKRKNIKKITTLCSNQMSFELGILDRFLHNYTDTDLPIEVKKMLGVGPKFAIPLDKKDIPVPTLIKDLEFCIQSLNLNEDDQDDLRAKCINNVTNFLTTANHCSGKCQTTNIIKKDYKVCQSFLKQNPQLIVMRSDKGNSTVVMYKEEYLSGMCDLLSDTGIYKPLKSDPTTRFQNQANKIVKDLFSNHYIDELTYKKLRTSNSMFPKLYGLRKTHKPGLSLRPVVSCTDAPSYNLATFIHNILNPITTTYLYNIKNSFEFVEFIKNVSLPPNHVLVSLDVTSLFTNIPKELVVKILKKNWLQISAYTDIPKHVILDIVEFLFNSSYFSFNNVFYQQLDGSAMGNPASPILANLVMNELITSTINKLPFDLPFIKLYVDDTLLSCPSNKVNDLLLYFNNFHEKIRFTMEIESNKSIPFLDVMVIRQTDGTLRTNWYTKPTSSGRVINYFSSHPMSNKIATIKNLLYRSYKLSSLEYHEANLNKIKDILNNNNYSSTLVNRIITNYKFNTQPNCDRALTRYFKFPYLKSLSEKIQLNIKEKNTHCKLAFYNIKTTNSLFSKLKDPTPQDMSSNLVYKIPCYNCEKCYIGITRQHLKSRLYQHQYDCRAINGDKKEKTALSQHHFSTGHKFNFTATSIVDREKHYIKRNISEMIQINLNNTVNNRSDTQGLSIQYNHILNLHRRTLFNSPR